MTATLLLHPNYAAAPILQKPRKGRLPGCIPKIRRAWVRRYDARLAEQGLVQKLDGARHHLQVLNEVRLAKMAEIALLQHELTTLRRKCT